MSLICHYPPLDLRRTIRIREGRGGHLKRNQPAACDGNGGENMKRAPSLLTAALALLLLTAPVLVTRAYAIPITFVASLRGDNEVPPTGSPGTGFATVVLDPAVHTMHVDVTFAGLVSPTTVAHVHCCLPSPLASGVNVMVATTTPTFPGFPAGVTSGSYSHDFDLTLASSYNPAFISSPIFNPSGTVAGAEAALEAGIQNR